MRDNSKSFFLIMLFVICIGCGGGGDNSFSPSTQQPDNDNSEEKQWHAVQLNTIESSGLHSPHLKFLKDDNDQFHTIYFSSAGTQDFTIFHQIWDSRTFQSINAKKSVISIDNCRDIGSGIVNDSPAVMYQGGSFPSCGDTEQSDVMISFLQNNEWKEYTVSTGNVERNPVIHNGVAGGSMDMIVDNQQQLHMCFQFFYEGCDSMNVNYPDIWYVKLSLDQLSPSPEPEVIEGNNYDNDNIQNNAGEHCSIALDNTQTPMVFYYDEAPLPENDKGLRFAYKQSLDQWQTEWVEKDCNIGYISAAWNDKRGIMGVAYYVEDDLSYSNTDQSLRYAEKINNEWHTYIIDDSCLCGNYCSLTFDNDGNPIIAYRADQSHSGYHLNELRVSRKINDVWKKETVSSLHNIGWYNTVIVDQSDTLYISTYSYDRKCIYIFYYQ